MRDLIWAILRKLEGVANSCVKEMAERRGGGVSSSLHVPQSNYIIYTA